MDGVHGASAAALVAAAALPTDAERTTTTARRVPCPPLVFGQELLRHLGEEDLRSVSLVAAEALALDSFSIGLTLRHLLTGVPPGQVGLDYSRIQLLSTGSPWPALSLPSWTELLVTGRLPPLAAGGGLFPRRAEGSPRGGGRAPSAGLASGKSS